jgi:HEAT repeat protein
MTRTLPAALAAVSLALASCHRPDPNSVEDQVALLRKAKTAREKEKALENLRRLGSKAAAPGLTEALAEASPKIRAQIAVVLGELKDPSSANALAEAIDLSAGAHRPDANAANKEIARALGDLGGPGAAKPLLRLLKATRDNFVRVETISALGRVKDRAAVPLLSELAESEEEEALISKKAILALSEINDPSALPTYVRMLFLERKGRSHYPEASFAIFKLGAGAQDRVLRVLKGEDKELLDWAREHKVATPALFAKAAQLECDLQDRHAAPVLIGLLRFEDRERDYALEVRKNAADALGRMRVREAAPALAAMLKEENALARSAYARALAQIGAAGAAPKLAACAKQGNFAAREYCMVGLVLLGAKRDAKTLGALLKGEPALFDKECKALEGEVDCAKEKEAIVAARVRIIEGYRKVLETAGGCAEDQCLEELLASPEPLARERAAYELGRRGSARSIPALIATIQREVKDEVDLNPRFAAVCAVDWIAAANTEARKAAATQVGALKALVKSDEKRALTQRIAEEVLRLATKLER